MENILSVNLRPPVLQLVASMPKLPDCRSMTLSQSEWKLDRTNSSSGLMVCVPRDSNSRPEDLCPCAIPSRSIKFLQDSGVLYGSRTPTRRGRRREREATYYNSMELSGMDRILPHVKDSGGSLLTFNGPAFSVSGGLSWAVGVQP